MTLRCFMVRRAQAEGEKSQYLAFNDADPQQATAHRKALIKTMDGNKGAFLDEAHALRAAEQTWRFTLERIEAAHGFVVDEVDASGASAPRELAWPADKDRILDLIPTGLKDLFRRTVDNLNFPASFDQFENAALIGSTTFPNF